MPNKFEEQINQLGNSFEMEMAQLNILNKSIQRNLSLLLPLNKKH